MTTVLAIDPGSAESAWMLYSPDDEIGFNVLDRGIAGNDEIVGRGFEHVFDEADAMAIEMIASYGMPVGKEVFETCVWIGRFVQVWKGRRGPDPEFIYRKEVKRNLCGNIKAKDSNVRQALIDRFGGSRKRAIGTKKLPGPLYGVKKDIWSALAVAVTWSDGLLAESGTK